MKTKRLLAMLMVGTMLTGTLAGCGGKKDDAAASGGGSAGDGQSAHEHDDSKERSKFLRESHDPAS